MTEKFMLRRYRPLLGFLFSGHRWIGWISFVGLSILILGIPFYFLWANPVGFVVAGIILCVYILMNAISFPSQMLSLISSKQIGLLPNIRQASYWMFAIMCTMVSGAIAVLEYFAKHTVVTPSYIAIFFLVSIVLIANVVVGQKFPRAQRLVFMSLWALPHIYISLKNVHPIMLTVTCASIWFGFYRHWLSWRPAKYIPNIFGMSQIQLRELNRQGLGVSNWQLNKLFSDKSNTLAGSILLGRADGLKARVVQGLSILLGLILVIGLFFAIFDQEKFRRFFVVGGQVYIYIMYFSFSYGLLQLFFRNINKAWLYFDGKREAFFSQIERTFSGGTISFCLPILFVHACASFLMLDWVVYRELVWLTAIYSLIVIATSFYAQLIIYHKLKGSLRWASWVNILSMLIFVIPVIAINDLWVEQKTSIIHSAYLFIGTSSVVIFMLRKWAKRSWLSVDFVRVTS